VAAQLMAPQEGLRSVSKYISLKINVFYLCINNLFNCIKYVLDLLIVLQYERIVS
jgi:hypothetical protein